MIVMKFGGTSVGSASRIKHVANLIHNSSSPVIAVLSAMSGTTNTLVAIAQSFYKKDKETAFRLISDLETKYISDILELYNTKKWQQATIAFIKDTMKTLRSFSNDLFTNFEEKCVVAQGELMSTQMMVNYLCEKNIAATMLPALDFMRTDKNGQPDMTQTKFLLEKLLNDKSKYSIYITQGFICRNAFGEIDNLQRGGSDYSASLIGATIKANEIQIWTDIDGVHNNDPRIVDGTTSVSQLSYEEASELAYFGAKILHPTCVRPAKQAKIPIRLKNTMQPDSEGTLINYQIDKGIVKAVAAKDNMAILRIYNSNNMSMSAFFASISQLCINYQTTIFISSCAEASMTICIENNDNIEMIIEDILAVGNVETKRDVCIITTVGDLTPSDKQFIYNTMTAMKTVDIHMISYGGSNYSISYVIDSSKKSVAMRRLSQILF